MELFGKEKSVAAIREKLACTWDEADVIYDVVVDTLKEAADEGEAVRIPGIGILRKVKLEAGEARNPQDGTTVQVGERVKYSLRSKPKAV